VGVTSGEWAAIIGVAGTAVGSVLGGWFTTRGSRVQAQINAAAAADRQRFDERLVALANRHEVEMHEVDRRLASTSYFAERVFAIRRYAEWTIRRFSPDLPAGLEPPRHDQLTDLVCPVGAELLVTRTFIDLFEDVVRADHLLHQAILTNGTTPKPPATMIRMAEEVLSLAERCIDCGRSDVGDRLLDSGGP
jgi:hypothetical protein